MNCLLATGLPTFHKSSMAPAQTMAFPSAEDTTCVSFNDFSDQYQSSPTFHGTRHSREYGNCVMQPDVFWQNHRHFRRKFVKVPPRIKQIAFSSHFATNARQQHFSTQIGIFGISFQISQRRPVSSTINTPKFHRA